MLVVQSTYSFIFAIVYLVTASPFVYARGRGGGGGSTGSSGSSGSSGTTGTTGNSGYVDGGADDGKGGNDGPDFVSDAASNLAVQSWQWATFVTAVIAGVFAIMIFYKSIQALDKYYRAIKKDGPSSLESWNTGTAFWAFGMLGSFFLAAFYPLLIVQALAPDLFNVLSVTYSQIPTGMMLMCANLADITIACAFLVLLHHRQTLHFGTTSTWKRLVDISLIFLMVVFTIVEAVFDSLTSTFQSLSKWRALVDINHLYLALYLVTTIDITVSSVILRRKVKATTMEDDRVCHVFLMGILT